MNGNRRPRTLLVLATDNWLSRAYLAVVVAATGFFLVDTFFVFHADASMSGVVPWVLTAPLSLLYTLLPEGTLNGTGDGAFLALYLVGIAAAALANAAFMGYALRKIWPASGVRLLGRELGNGARWCGKGLAGPFLCLVEIALLCAELIVGFKPSALALVRERGVVNAILADGAPGETSISSLYVRPWKVSWRSARASAASMCSL